MKLTTAKLREMIKEELNNTMDEGLENITPENIQMVIDALVQSGLLGAGVAAMGIAAVSDKLMNKKPQAKHHPLHPEEK